MAATEVQKIAERLDMALRSAQAVEQANRDNGGPSTAYDAGRVAGLKEALEIVQAVGVK